MQKISGTVILQLQSYFSSPLLHTGIQQHTPYGNCTSENLKSILYFSPKNNAIIPAATFLFSKNNRRHKNYCPQSGKRAEFLKLEIQTWMRYHENTCSKLGNKHSARNKTMISYKILHTKDMNRSFFDHFIRHQTVVKCWRREHGSWIIRDDPFTDDWSEDDYRQIISHLKSLLCSNGFVCGAFYQNTLKRFVSEDMRRMGIGRTLLDVWMQGYTAGSMSKRSHMTVRWSMYYNCQIFHNICLQLRHARDTQTQKSRKRRLLS